MRQVRKQKAAASRSPRRSARLIHLASPLPFPLSSTPPPYFRQASSCPHLELVRNVLLDRQLVAHALLHKLWHLRAALVAAKGSAAPPAAGDELEGARANLVAGSGDANHARLAPAAVRRLWGGSVTQLRRRLLSLLFMRAPFCLEKPWTWSPKQNPPREPDACRSCCRWRQRCSRCPTASRQ